MEQPGVGSGSSKGYSCLSCHVTFATPTGQREHMRTDWHRYNLKRKVVDLPPLNAEAFQAKVHQATQAAAAQAAPALHCQACGGKEFKTAAAMQHHLGTKKHAERAARQAASSSVAPPPAAATTANDGGASTATSPDAPSPTDDRKVNWRRELASATTNAELEALLKRKEAASFPLTARHCLFCPGDAFPTIPEALEHMSAVHSFFLPDQSYLQDAEGLLTYLAYKVAVLNTCLYCNGKGKGFFSLEAVRTHMADMSHCKVEYELDGGQDELNEWYDFGHAVQGEGGAEDEEDAEWEDVEADEMSEVSEAEGEGVIDLSKSAKSTKAHGKAAPTASVLLTPDESQLILPSGAVIGSRAFNTVWRQHLPSGSGDSALPVGECIVRTHGRGAQQMAATAGRTAAGPLSLTRAQVEEKQAQNRSLHYGRQVFLAKVGVKHNKLQHYYRSQLGFGV